MLRPRRTSCAWPAIVGVVIVLAALPGSALGCGKDGCTETSTGTAPPDGSLVTHTDAIPADATQGSFTVQPMAGTDPNAFDEVTSVLVDSFPWLSKVSKRNQAVLACALISYLPFASKPQDEPITYTDLDRQVMLLNICLRMALSIPNTPAARAHARAAAGACGQIMAAVTVKISHTRAGYRGVVAGKLHKPGRTSLRVSCHRKGKGIVLNVRPRKRGQTLRQAGGPTLAIAYHNPSSKPVGIRTTFKVN